jgi:hypothetical protein
VSEQPIATAPRSPIQNLLDEVEPLGMMLGVISFDEQGQIVLYPMNEEIKNHIKDLIRSAYATGRAHV